jgi:hypothetical protein
MMNIKLAIDRQINASSKFRRRFSVGEFREEKNKNSFEEKLKNGATGRGIEE